MKILGISCYYHDAAAALIEDGKIIAATEEERFSRVKHDSSFPRNAINFCLKEANIKSKQLDYVVFYEKPFLKFERITLSFLATAPWALNAFISAYKIWLKEKLWIKERILTHVKISGEKLLFSHHHLSHAASAFYTSPFDSAAILTCDGVGEWTTTAWGVGRKNKVYLKEEIRFPHSLGLFYSTVTQYLGFQINEGEFKVMGLAPYGKPGYVKKVERLIRQEKDGSFRLNLEYFNFHLSDKVSFSEKFIRLFGVPPVDPKDSDKVVKVYADIAASAQKVLEEKLIVIAKNIRQKTGETNLCYAGGVALNGVANWRIFKEAGFENIFIHPAAGDSGGALGAALYLYHHVLGKHKRSRFNHAYLGQAVNEEEIKKFIRKRGIKAERFSDKKLVEKLAELLVDGKVIGWVRGRFEWGPRALGARSILADPRSKRMKDLVNSKIKFREAFRPFAPVTLYKKGAEYYDLGEDYKQAPLKFMLGVVSVKKKWRSKLGAITHVDGTARPQLIERSVNPLYYDLINAFGKKTGVYTLLNTSFNLKGEPIVNTVDEAYSTFMRSGLDALVLGNYLVEK
ncbi:carbamoyltransferase [Candidatus Woesebacteria bacterium]|nr:carbamoyltransferase [Candidatus Woesebacteria bacterium]